MLLSNDEWLAIAEQLLVLTSARALGWQGEPDPRSNEEGMIFRTQVRDTEYTLGSVDGDGALPYYLEIWDKGVPYDRIASPSSSRAASSDELTMLRSRLRDLYREAFRGFHRAPEQAEKFLRELEVIRQDSLGR